MKWGLAIGLWGFTAAAFAGQDQRHAIPLRGTPFSAALVSVNEQGDVALEAGGQTRRMRREELVLWGHVPGTSRGAQLLLGDGGRIMGTLLKIEDDAFVLETRLWSEVRIPRGATRGIVFQPPADVLEQDRLQHRVVARSGPQDHLWLANGDELDGRLLKTPAEPGVADLFGLVAVRVAVEAGGEPLTLDIHELVGAALRKTPGPPASVGHTICGFRDGTCLRVGSLTVQDGSVRLNLPSGVSLVAASPRFFRELALWQPLGPPVRYLSDEEPASYKHVPFLERVWPLARDQSADGGRLRWNGRVYEKGLGMHSTARTVFDLENGDRAFQAELALDACAAPFGSVTYRVFLETPESDNGPRRWQLAYQSSTVRAGQEPVPIVVELGGAIRIALVVDFADRGDVGDHANWLNARIVD